MIAAMKEFGVIIRKAYHRGLLSRFTKGFSSAPDDGDFASIAPAHLRVKNTVGSNDRYVRSADFFYSENTENL